MNQRFEEQVDIPRLQALTDAFFQATQIPAALVDLEGNILTDSGWQHLRAQFHRRHPDLAKAGLESDLRTHQQSSPGEPFVLSRCPMGLTDASMPVVLGGKHVAHVFAGPLFTEPPDAVTAQAFREQARNQGLDEESFLRAFREIPVLPLDRFRSALVLLARLVGLAVNAGLSRMPPPGHPMAAGFFPAVAARRPEEAVRQTLLSLQTRLSAATTPTEAGRIIFHAADQLWDWDCGTLDLLIPGENRVQEVMNIDVVDGVRRDIPLVRPDGELTPRIRQVLSHGPELTLRPPNFQPPPDVLPFGDTTRLSASIMTAPIRCREGNIGILSIQSYRPCAFHEEDLRMLQALADHCGGALARIHADEKLRQSERQLATLISNLPGFVYRCANDHDWTMTFLSDGCQAITGYAPDDLLHNRKLPYNALIHPGHRARIWLKWQELLARQETFEDEYPIQTAGGQTRWVWERGRGIFSEAGTLLHLEGFITDVTERRQAEETLQQQAAELRARNEELTRFNRAATGRELRMIELKREINELCHRLGLPPRHALPDRLGQPDPAAPAPTRPA